MDKPKFFKLIVLPTKLEPDAFYYIDNGAYAESYVTDALGNASAIGNSAMINALIDARLLVVSDLHFEFVQATPSASWVITHNLDKFPSVSIVDTSNDRVHGSVHYTNKDNLIITFSASFSGKAYLN